VRSLNVGWYRSELSFVGQEPVLFDMSIAANIAFGLEGASQQDIEHAAKQVRRWIGESLNLGFSFPLTTFHHYPRQMLMTSLKIFQRGMKHRWGQEGPNFLEGKNKELP